MLTLNLVFRDNQRAKQKGNSLVTISLRKAAPSSTLVVGLGSTWLSRLWISFHGSFDVRKRNRLGKFEYGCWIMWNLFAKSHVFCLLSKNIHYMCHGAWHVWIYLSTSQWPSCLLSFLGSFLNVLCRFRLQTIACNQWSTASIHWYSNCVLKNMIHFQNMLSKWRVNVMLYIAWIHEFTHWL